MTSRPPVSSAASLPSTSSDRFREAVVLGGGVAGLSTAIRLCEAGPPVTLVTAELATDIVAPKRAGEWPPSPCSPWAAAIWYPYRAEPRDRVARWSVETLHELRRIALDPAAGVRDVVLTELFSADEVHDELWHAAVAVERVRDGLPPGVATMLRMTVPMIDTPIYLPWLVRRFEAVGGRIERRVVNDLASLTAPGRLVVNCTGLGARRLCGDEAVHPVRGQIVRVAPPTEPRHLVHDSPDGSLTYVFARGTDCILGGTAEDEVWDEAVSDADAAAILARCRALAPSLGEVRELGRGAGLRPARRGSIRLEVEAMRDGMIVHNYGHGGAGYTLSWGCADEVVRLGVGGLHAADPHPAA